MVDVIMRESRWYEGKKLVRGRAVGMYEGEVVLQGGVGQGSQRLKRFSFEIFNRTEPKILKPN